MPDDTFVPKLVQIGQETAEKRWREKKRKEKKSKPTEKYNITPDFEKFHFYKNGNIIIIGEMLSSGCFRPKVKC